MNLVEKYLVVEAAVSKYQDNTGQMDDWVVGRCSGGALDHTSAGGWAEHVLSMSLQAQYEKLDKDYSKDKAAERKMKDSVMASVITVWFNAWQYSGDIDVWAGARCHCFRLTVWKCLGLIPNKCSIL
jgi:hypothetical protein